MVAVGMANGVLSVRHKKHNEDKQEVAVRKRRGPAYRVFVKGKNYVPKQVRLLKCVCVCVSGSHYSHVWSGKRFYFTLPTMTCCWVCP